MFKTLVNKGQGVNPFVTQMYYRISFMTWLNAYRQSKGTLQEAEEE